MSKKIQFEKGSGNVFKDLDLPNAGELFLKAKLGFEVFQIIEKRKLTQTESSKDFRCQTTGNLPAKAGEV